VLAACLRDTLLRAHARELLTPDDFGDARCSESFAALLALDDDGRSCDPVSVRAELRQRDTEFDDALAWLEETAAIDATSDTMRQHAAIVVELSRKRRMALSGTEIAKAAFDASVRADEVAAFAEAELTSWSATTGEDVTTRELTIVVHEVIERVDEARASGSTLRGLRTGLHDLDDVLCGLEPGYYVVGGGRPGVGKSAFVTGIALHNARLGVPTLLISAEMSADELALRMLAADAHVSTQRLRMGSLSSDERAALDAAEQRYASWPLWIDDKPAPSIDHVRSVVRKYSRTGGLGLLLVDYLQFLTLGSPAERRELEVSQVSRSLKALARSEKCVVIAMAQLNRKLEDRADKRPHLADLRESGQIEQDADVVLFLHREAMFDPDADPGLAEVVVAKNRHGPRGTAKVTWLASSTRFVSRAMSSIPAGEPS
jgi:replicative DNA helicase